MGVCSCDVGAELAKYDVKSSFCILPVHPDDLDLLDFVSAGAVFMDRAVPMGCSVFCAAFEHFSSFLDWELWQNVGFKTIAHYLDYFLFCGKRQLGHCRQLMESFQKMACKLVLPLGDKKTEGPPSTLTFLGIELDTLQQFFRPPAATLEDLRARLKCVQAQKKVTLQELQ